jgi:hypothetical protein
MPDHVAENIASWSNQTIIHPVGISVLVLLTGWVMLAKRHWVPIAYLILACLAARQRIAIASLDFTFIRLLILVGWVRICMMGELQQIRWRALDLVVLAWAAVAMTAWVVLNANSAAAVYMAGQTIDTAGAYILFRALIRDWSDLKVFARAAAVVAIPLAVAFSIEKATGRNMFWVFGGVPQFTPIRQGELRCQGAFVHPILAGVFWATLLPLIVSVGFTDRRYKPLAIVGTVAALIIIVTTASSTPLAGVAAAVAAGLFFPLRHFMRYLKWIAVAGVITLHLVMNAPVWHLIGRIDLVGGSTGYHRYRLIDAAVNHFNEWWMFGTISTAHWGRQLFDVTNQYILEGTRGGFLRLVLFCAILIMAFNCVGRAIRRLDRGPRAVMAWAIGAALFVNMACFIAVSYFGSIVMLWHLLLATAATTDHASILTLRRQAKARRLRRQRAARQRTADPMGGGPSIAGVPA